MNQSPPDFHPNDCSNVTFKLLDGPAVLEVCTHLPQWTLQALKDHLRIWECHVHDRTYLGQICNDLQETDETGGGASKHPGCVHKERFNIEEEIDEIFRTYGTPVHFLASLLTAPKSPGNGPSEVFLTPRIHIIFPRYGVEGPDTTDDLLEFLKRFTNTLKLCRAEHIWTLLLRLHVGGDLLDVLNEIGQDGLDWATARKMIEKRLFRPIHRSKLVEAALDGYQGSAASPYERIRHNIKLAKKLRVLSVEELTFYIIYYSLDPEYRKEVRMPDDPADCTLEYFQRQIECSGILLVPFNKQVEETNGKWCSFHRVRSHDTSECRAKQVRCPSIRHTKRARQALEH